MMVSTLLNAKNLRQAMRESLPEIDHAGDAASVSPAFTYVPPSHAKALHADACLVEGIRGSGKSFWWATLSSEPHRRFLRLAFPESEVGEGMVIERGFGALPSSVDAPSQDVLAQLVRALPPRAIWKALVGYKAGFPEPFPCNLANPNNAWRERVEWVSENSETFDTLLLKADEMLEAQGKTLIILFDALDRLADDWQSIRPLAKSLLQFALDLRATRRIRLKIFVRPDMLEDRAIIGFPDASKLIARKASLIWRRVDLYALLFQCLGNSNISGHDFREFCDRERSLIWVPGDGVWIQPKAMRTEESLQEKIFIALAGKAMASGPSGIKRGKPYSWLVNHLQDGRDQVSPRSFFEAIRKAAEHTPEENPLPLHFRGIQQGVQAASQIRVNEITGEDYPWVEEVMRPLRGQVTVPCPSADISSLWYQDNTLARLADSLGHSGDKVKLPPQNLQDGAEGVLKDLELLGLIQRLSDRRIQMPDVYRIAFGIGRRGGVKPLK